MQLILISLMNLISHKLKSLNHFEKQVDLEWEPYKKLIYLIGDPQTFFWIYNTVMQ